ncbi:hypothetical protein NO1_2149 [Candidatus Termititenax aidoneus]|uniref:Uncharacterized protein n=1 Tax=Termititenax aidoneus TaxID=2218524 RepID=A0A388TDS5_TERA1|nr:hypothetical protein NO1_2149 [Candidatus Termititenax aidoneus]
MNRENRLAKLLQGFMDSVVDATTKGISIPAEINRAFVKSYGALRKLGYEEEVYVKK